MLYGKWVIALLLLLSLLSMRSTACDLCSVYLGINPDDYKNSFGLINRIRVFESAFQPASQANRRFARLEHLGTITDQGAAKKIVVREVYRSYDLWVKYFINQKWQLNFSATFTDNDKFINDTLINNISGVGDVLGIVKYQVMNTKSPVDSVSFVHRLTVGAGIEAPTGSFNKPGMLETFDEHMQAGTGSVDCLLLLEYLVRHNKIGFNSNVTYKINSENRNKFRFANRFNSNVALFYLAKIKKLTFMPSAGLSFESGERDRSQGEKFLGSGGEALFVTTEMKLFYKRIAAGLRYFTKPLHEDLYDQSLQLNNKYRIVTELTYYF